MSWSKRSAHGDPATWAAGRAELPAAPNCRPKRSFDHQDLAACAADGAQLPIGIGVPWAEWVRRPRQAASRARCVPQAFRPSSTAVSAAHRAQPPVALDVLPQGFHSSRPGHLNDFFSGVAAAPSGDWRSRSGVATPWVVEVPALLTAPGCDAAAGRVIQSPLDALAPCGMGPHAAYREATLNVRATSPANALKRRGTRLRGWRRYALATSSLQSPSAVLLKAFGEERFAFYSKSLSGMP